MNEYSIKCHIKSLKTTMEQFQFIVVEFSTACLQGEEFYIP